MNCWSRLLLFFLLTFSYSVDAQQLITSYSVDQGLPQSTVTSLYRDNEGYLWCGTGHGLGLYDGREFIQPKITGTEKSAPVLTAAIRGIVASTDQKTVWVGTEGSLYQFDRFSLKPLRSFDVTTKTGAAECPIFANDTAVWVACAGTGIYRVRIADGKSVQLSSSGYSGGRASFINGKYILYTDSSANVLCIDIFSSVISGFTMPSYLSGLDIHGALNMSTSDEEAFVYSRKGLWNIDCKSGSFKRVYLGDPRYVDTLLDITGMDVHPDGSWWLAVNGTGVFRYDPTAKQLRACMWQQDGTYMGKQLESAKNIVCDDYGVVWCGTDASGLVKLLHGRVTFRSKYCDQLITDTCIWFTRCFFELSSDRYLIGTYQHGIRYINHETNTIKAITGGISWENTNPLFISGSGEGRLLIGTDRSLLLIDTVKWIATTVDIGTAPDLRFIGCLDAANGKKYVYGNGGMRELVFEPLPKLLDPVGEVGNITSVIQLRNGNIITASRHQGIALHDADCNLIHLYNFETEVGIELASNIRGFVEDGKDRLWIGLESGLYRLDGAYHIAERFTTENGLPDNIIYDMLAVNADQFVLATGHGICLFDCTGSSCRNYGSQDGLPSDECNSGALMTGRSGLLYIGTTGGFVRWNPGQSNFCFRKTILLASYNEGDGNFSGIIGEQIIRNYGSGPIELNIWQTDFAFPERVMFYYQLEGSGEPESIEAGLRKVNYSALGSGFYSFLCSVEVPGCERTEIAKLLTIKIVPPFWMSGWFIGITSIGAILMITLILFAAIRMNYQRKLRKLKLQQELDRVRHRISRDIHDEIGAGLTRIALSGDLMSQKIPVDDAQYAKLKAIAGTARELSQSMKEVVWSVNPHYDSLDHMAAYFRSYVAGVAENADVRFKYVADEDLPAESVNPETRRNLLLILKETISNSVKYSQCTELKLEIRWSNKILTVLISDNGKGFDLHGGEGVNSNGLRNISQRAQASNCKVSIESAPSKGTVISITGPIS